MVNCKTFGSDKFDTNSFMCILYLGGWLSPFIIFLLGAAVKVHLLCNDGHEEEWSSSSNVTAGRRRVPLINLMIVCYALFTGLHWTQFKVRIYFTLV